MPRNYHPGRTNEYRVENGITKVDFTKVMKRKSNIVSSWENGIKESLKQAQILLYFLARDDLSMQRL